jgi:hypothetical protein
VLEAASGKQRATLRWGVEHPYGGIVCTSGETFVAATLDRLRLYTIGLAEIEELRIPPASKPGWMPWALYSSPDGRSLLLAYYEPRFSPSNAPTRRERALVTTDEDYQWIDSRTLRPLCTWTEGILQYFSISGTKIARIEHRLISWYFRDYVSLRTMNGPWVRTAETQYYGEPQFVSNDVLALVLWNQIAFVRTDGTALFKQDLDDDDWLLGPHTGRMISPSANGQRVAVPIWVRKGYNDFLDVSGHLELSRIMVFDLPRGEWVYTLDTKKRKLRTLSGLALSPDGSRMAVALDGVVEVYQLPASEAPPGTATAAPTPF